jgi:DNA-binding SARP family transcriptional activator
LPTSAATNASSPRSQMAQRLLALNPLHEGAHASLMQLYARQGRRDSALQQYRLFADRLWDEVGEKPAAQTLYRRLLERAVFTGAKRALGAGGRGRDR